jgi:hypothetical protein
MRTTTNYSHSRCYANKTNNCSTKISSEHFISENILASLEQNKKIKIAGLPWMERQTFNLLSRSNLASNILCTNHNELLSPYDTEAGNLHKAFIEFDADFNNKEVKDETRKFKGDLIEKWMLKTVCGLIASNQIAKNGTKQSILLKDIYIDILFGDKECPNLWGLYFKIPADNQIHKFNCLSVLPMTANNEVKCGEFWFNNFTFNFLLGNPDQPDAWGIHRVNKLHFTDGVAVKTIEFEWDDAKCNKWVELKRVVASQEHPKNWEDWMKK